MLFFRPNITKLKANGRVEKLCKLLDSRNFDVRRQAEDALATMGIIAIEQLSKILKKANKRRNINGVINALSRMQTPHALDTLFVALYKEELRVSIVASLSRHGGVPAINKAIENLSNDNRVVAEACVSIVSSSATPKAVEALFAAYPRLKTAVWKGLARIAERDVTPIIPYIDAKDEQFAHLAKRIINLFAESTESLIQPMTNLLLQEVDFYRARGIINKFAPTGEERGPSAFMKPATPEVQRLFAQSVLRQVSNERSIPSACLRFIYELMVRTFGLESNELKQFAGQMPWISRKQDCIVCWRSEVNEILTAIVPVYGTECIGRLCKGCGVRIRNELAGDSHAAEARRIYPELWDFDHFVRFLKSMPIVADSGDISLGGYHNSSDDCTESIYSRECPVVKTEQVARAMLELWTQEKSRRDRVFLGGLRVTADAGTSIAHGIEISVIRISADRWKGAYSQWRRRVLDGQDTK